MPKRKGRDWSEWKEHINGMHRLDKGYTQRHLGRTSHQLQTQTGISLRDYDLEYEDDEKEPRLWVWVLVFVGMLILRKYYQSSVKKDRLDFAGPEITRIRSE